MKKLLTILLCVLVSSLSYAEPISEQEAYQIAQKFMQGKLKANGKQAAKRMAKRIAATQKNLYIFNVEEKGGFVIVSGDDRTPSILGYSDRGELDTDNLPCNAKWLLDSYDKAISNLSVDYKPSTTRASETKADIATLIDTQWGQGTPYNNLCPQMSDGQNCLTGCVTTAMAQVINYHRWPQGQTSSVPQYVSATNKITMAELPVTTFDWNNMGDAAIGRLMLYCGQSVSMDYDVVGSGAYSGDVASALTNVFGYSKGAALQSRGSFSDDEWDNAVYDELQKGQPVLYFGQSETSGGHAFIVDGYSDGKYHINWGWEGYCDGYFSLSTLNPMNDSGFNISQEMIANVCPPAGVGDIDRPKAVVSSISCTDRALERTDATAAYPSFTVSATVESDLSEAATLQVGLGLYNDDGLVAVLKEESHDFAIDESYTIEAEVTLDASLAQGNYRIVAINRSGDTAEWLANSGSTTRYISVTVEETLLQLQPMPKSDDDQYDFGTHTIDGITYHLYSSGKNNNAEVYPLSETKKYSGDVYIPDNVVYQNITFEVMNVNDDAFNNCPDLTSISTSAMWVGAIVQCPKLSKLELREGVFRTDEVFLCESLENITFPSTCSYLSFPSNCEGMKSITFVNKKGFEIHQNLSLNGMPAFTDIYFTGDFPPAIRYGECIPNENVTIHIPSGTIEAYKKSIWTDWTLVEDQEAIPVNVHWDYCGNWEEGAVESSGFALGRGYNYVELAMWIPANCLDAYKGCKITAVEFYLPRRASYGDRPSYYNIEYVFVTTDGTDYLTKKSVNTIIRGAWMTVELDQPYTITGEALYVGIGKYSSIGMNWVEPDAVDDGFWTRVMGTDTSHNMEPGLWEKLAGLSTGWNYPLPIRAIIEGEKLPTDIAVASVELTDRSESEQSYAKNFAKVSNIDLNGGYFSCATDGNGNYYSATQPQKTVSQIRKAASSKQQFKVKLRNRTPRTVKQVTIGWDIDGKHQGQQAVEAVMLPNHEDIVYLDLPDYIVGRNHTMKVNVSSIDGEADEIPANSTKEISYAVLPSTYYPRKVVMEEVTGTWCGYCPRGIVAIEGINREYPDNFIDIAVHDDSEMWPIAYDSLFSMISAVPIAYINRLEWADPAFANLSDAKNGGAATIKATASFAHSEEKINVTTESVFGFSDDGSTEYRIAYVLLEDSVGPYYQRNYYSDPTANHSDDIMDWWIHQDAYVETVYNDVARAIYDYNGIEGLLPLEITEGETYKSEYILTLPNNIQNAKNLKVVVLLLDTSTSEILNADRTAISGEVPSGIGTISKDNFATFDVYNLMGIKVRVGASSLNGLPQGVYIVNGKKIAVI